MTIQSAGRSPLGRTIAILTSLFILAILGILSYTVVTLHDHKVYSLVIDLAGRQRMLNQRHMREILLVAQGLQVDYHATRKAFNDTLQALSEGGPAVVSLGADQTVTLPPPPTEALRQRFAEQKRFMAEFTTKADRFLLLRRDDPASPAKLKELLALNARLHEAANDAVAMLGKHSEAKIVTMIKWETIVGVLVTLLGILLTRQITVAHRKLENEIAERKRAEQELRESEAQRIAALQQSDALKSALLSSVSHELRTPLTTIKASVSSLFDDPGRMPAEMRAEFLAGINQEIDYLDRLVNNLLDMSRIEAGTLVPRREWHPLEELLEGAIRRVGPMLQERPLDLKLPDSMPPVYVDGVEIQQVLMNLLDNAVKYSPRGTPISIQVAEAGKVIEVRVSNSGKGIPPEDLERVFDRFHRVRSKHEHAIPGTGLGLAICKGIVEAHGGRIWAESVPHGLTAITFTIPITEPMPSFSLERPQPLSNPS